MKPTRTTAHRIVSNLPSARAARIASDVASAARAPAVSTALLMLGALVAIALPAAADLAPEVRLSLGFDPVIDEFAKSEPCGLPGGPWHVSGRCLSIPSSGECVRQPEPASWLGAAAGQRVPVVDSAPLGRRPGRGGCAAVEASVPEDGSPAGGRARVIDLGGWSGPGSSPYLDLLASSWVTLSDGSERLAVVPKGRNLFVVPVVETACGTWRAEMVIDPPSLQVPSMLVLRHDDPSSDSGSTSGILSLGIRTRYLRADGRIVEIPGLLDVDLAGTWRRLSGPDPSSPDRLSLESPTVGVPCWQPDSFDPSAWVDQCREPSCPAEGPLGCFPWCVLESPPAPSQPRS